ncbi:MAG TPA: TRAP transporter large permease [Burkholderiaceae bacterium]|nr:TRAP transporter large permease [Burkholderiaceae bacterium]
MMGTWEISLIGLGALLALMMAGLQIGFAMLVVGAAGIAAIIGPKAALGMLGQVPAADTMSYTLSVLPMFVLMGVFVDRGGLSQELFDACQGFLGGQRGGLAMATIAACGGFSAVCGSSLATTGTMGKVAIPSMRRYGYADSLAAGTVTAGGTLGILIPPSVILVLYGIMTGTDIGLLFIAGLLPGLIAITLYILTIAVLTRRRPELGPSVALPPMRERLIRLRRVFPVLVLFVVIIGGIYMGLFTPTEAAGVGSFGALLFAMWRRTLTFQQFIDCLVESARITAVLFIVLIGALLFSNFVNLAGLPNALQALVQDLGLSPLATIAIMMVMYLIMGCFLESLSMMLLTVPIFFPMVMGLGYHPIWFGIIVVMVMELALITPPVGLNLFVLKSTAPDISLGTIYRGVMPFVLVDIFRLTLFILVPSIILILPELARI